MKLITSTDEATFELILNEELDNGYTLVPNSFQIAPQGTINITNYVTLVEKIKPAKNQE